VKWELRRDDYEKMVDTWDRNSEQDEKFTNHQREAVIQMMERVSNQERDAFVPIAERATWTLRNIQEAYAKVSVEDMPREMPVAWRRIGELLAWYERESGRT
jgi:hypothetical protein